jgi:uncharacterized protein (TIGR02246 family)
MPAPARCAVLVSLVLFCRALAAPVADASRIQAEVSRVDAARVEALLKNDLKALERIYSDQLVYVHSAGRVDSKQQYLASLAAGNLTYVSLRYEPPADVRVVSADTAVVTGRAHIEAKSKSGQVTKRVLTTITVYVRAADGWRAVSYQGTPVQP